MPKPTYLGDGVYASETEDGFMMQVTTGHHEVHSADNVIYLEKDVAVMLRAFIDEWLSNV